MNYYFAPMEGITSYIYRNAHHTFFHHIDKYFTPFISPNKNKCFNSRELNDILPENNKGLTVIPQILTNNAEDFIRTSKELQQFGYKEINLNLGCPSGTVVSKSKGSGFLAHPEQLNLFLESIYSQSDIRISIKTRLGKDCPDEFYHLIDIFNQYPVEELIIHPRIQKDYYKNKPNLKIFEDALTLSKNPLCYNGDLFTISDYNTLTETFPNVRAVMFGRGIIANPHLTNSIHCNALPDKQLIKDFHDKIYRDYQAILSGDRNILFKMKELWFYMIHMFSDDGKYAKKIRKSERLCDYESVVSEIFSNLEIVKEGGFFSF